MKSPRALAFAILARVQQTGAFAAPLLQATARRHQLSQRDSAFLWELVLGSLRHRHSLEASLQPLLRSKFGKLPPQTRHALCLGAYQIVHMRVPAYSAVSETLKHFPQANAIGQKKLINAVLRKLAAQPPASAAKSTPSTMPIYGLPASLLAELETRRGPAAAARLVKSFTQKPGLCLRVNLLRSSALQLQQQLQAHGLSSEILPSLDHHLACNLLLASASGNPAQLPGYAQGWFYVQDWAATQVGLLADPKPGQVWLDLCAAPGGKATHLAELQQDRGTVVAIDIHPARLARLHDSMQRLGLGSIKPVVADSCDRHRLQTALQSLHIDHVDGVLLDAPCSGLGTLRRHPEKLLAPSPPIDELVAQQAQLLQQAAALVAVGGSLVYAVCTITAAEGPEQIARFLAQHRNFKLREASRATLLTWSDLQACDSFYAAHLVRHSA